jgi:hypothetical protein
MNIVRNRVLISMIMLKEGSHAIASYSARYALLQDENDGMLPAMTRHDLIQHLRCELSLPMELPDPVLFAELVCKDPPEVIAVVLHNLPEQYVQAVMQCFSDSESNKIMSCKIFYMRAELAVWLKNQWNKKNQWGSYGYSS